MVVIPVKGVGEIPECEFEGEVMAKGQGKKSTKKTEVRKNDELPNSPDQDLSLEELVQENERLMAGFNQYWSLVARKEVGKTFTREAPYVQEMISEESYKLYMNLLYKSELRGVEVLGVTCEQPFLCCVDCRLTFLSHGKTVSRSLRDCWVRVQNKWYHIFKNPIIYPQLGEMHPDEKLCGVAG